MKPSNLVAIGFGLVMLGGIGNAVGNFLYEMVDTSFGPAGGSTLLPHYVLPHVPVLPQTTFLCEGVTNGRWVGCSVSVPEIITTAQAKTPSAPVKEGANLQGKAADSVIEVGTDGDTLAFDKTQFKVKANSIVLLKFKNNAVQSKMPHNLVIVAPNSEAKVATAGLTAGEKNNWVPSIPEVIAHTSLIQGGEQTEVKFTAPAAGKYPFICSFPGHYLSMKGVMTVE